MVFETNLFFFARGCLLGLLFDFVLVNTSTGTPANMSQPVQATVVGAPTVVQATVVSVNAQNNINVQNTPPQWRFGLCDFCIEYTRLFYYGKVHWGNPNKEIEEMNRDLIERKKKKSS